MPAELRPWDHGGGNLERGEREHLSHSSLSTFLACPQKHAFRYVEGLELRRRPEPLTLGSAYQLAIEHNDPWEGVNRLRSDARISSQADEDRLQVHEAIVHSASSLYLEHFSPSETSVKEFEYRVRLRSPYTGAVSRTFDLLGFADEWLDLGAYAGLVENKLVGQLGETNLRRLPLDRQLALECYGTWRATGKPVREVWYRFMRKPSIRQRKGESVEEFCARIAEDYVTRPDFYLHEEHLIRSEADLLRIEEELWEWARQLRAQRNQKLFPRNTSHCAEFGGCPYMAMCLREPGAEALYDRRDSSQSAGTIAA